MGTTAIQKLVILTVFSLVETQNEPLRVTLYTRPGLKGSTSNVMTLASLFESLSVYH